MLRCPRPRPRHLAPLRCASLHRPRSARAPLGGQMRSAPRNTNFLNNFLAITKNFDKISMVFIWAIINHISKPPILKALMEKNKNITALKCKTTMAKVLSDCDSAEMVKQKNNNLTLMSANTKWVQIAFCLTDLTNALNNFLHRKSKVIRQITALP